MFFLVSGNTTFIIGGLSNFECKLAKNLIEVVVNNNSGPRKPASSSSFSHQTKHQKIGGLL
jgi:hypothetical protein